jgi:hypothetical protein
MMEVGRQWRLEGGRGTVDREGELGISRAGEVRHSGSGGAEWLDLWRLG